MTAEGHKVASLHGAKDAQERDTIIDRFREGKEKVLITTNVVARGIDIMQVNMVVNYDLPLLNERGGGGSRDDARPDVETYSHRIGAFEMIKETSVEPSSYGKLMALLFRTYGTIWTERCFHQLRS